jgi:hypothetical protein
VALELADPVEALINLVTEALRVQRFNFSAGERPRHS